MRKIGALLVWTAFGLGLGWVIAQLYL